MKDEGGAGVEKLILNTERLRGFGDRQTNERTFVIVESRLKIFDLYFKDKERTILFRLFERLPLVNIW